MNSDQWVTSMVKSNSAVNATSVQRYPASTVHNGCSAPDNCAVGMPAELAQRTSACCVSDQVDGLGEQPQVNAVTVTAWHAFDRAKGSSHKCRCSQYCALHNGSCPAGSLMPCIQTQPCCQQLLHIGDVRSWCFCHYRQTPHVGYKNTHRGYKVHAQRLQPTPSQQGYIGHFGGLNRTRLQTLQSHTTATTSPASQLAVKARHAACCGWNLWRQLTMQGVADGARQAHGS
jgi:hypothetical protein